MEDADRKLIEFNRRWRGCKITDPQADAIIRENCKVYDRIRAILSKRCGAPDCGYMLSSLEESFAVPDFGAVCGVCYHMYHALQAPGLANKFYFRQLHDQWKEEIKEFRATRRRLGLE